MINLKGKTAVVFGLANKRSIAWGIAQKLHAGRRHLGHLLSKRAHEAGGPEPHR